MALHPTDCCISPTRRAKLFRFSALTYNAHRIHYDADYARDVEGFPGLVVHGPLLAVHATEAVRSHHPDREVIAVEHRLRAPAYVGEQIVLEAGTSQDRIDVAVTVDGRRRCADVIIRFAPLHGTG